MRAPVVLVLAVTVLAQTGVLLPGRLVGGDDFPSVRWTVEVADPDDGVGINPTLVLDPSDRPYIAHYDTDHERLLLTTKVNGVWGTEVVDDTDRVGESPSIALDSKGRIAVSYAPRGPVMGIDGQPFPEPARKGLRYAVRTDSGWDRVEIPFSGGSSLGGWAGHTSLALDAYDRPHISFSDWNRVGVHYATWGGTAWSAEMVDAEGALRTALVVDSKGDPHLIYERWGSSYMEVYHAARNGTGWDRTYLGPGGFVVTDLSLTIDSLDGLHALWRGREGLKYAVRDVNGWQTTTLASEYVYDVAVALEHDSPRLFYRGPAPVYGAREADWEFERVDAGVQFSFAYFSSHPLAVDGRGTPHLSARGVDLDAGLLYLSRDPPTQAAGVLMSTDKACYAPGEPVRITATGLASVPSVGDFPGRFWAITDASGEPITETLNDLLANGVLNGTLDGVWDQTYVVYDHDTWQVRPPTGEQVPEGTYTIWFYDLFFGPNEPTWTPATIEIRNDCPSNLEVLTDKECYRPGETVTVTLRNGGPETLGWAHQPPPMTVENDSGGIVAMPGLNVLTFAISVLPNQTYPVNLSWNQTYFLYDGSENILPPSYDQVPDGYYFIQVTANAPPGVQGSRRILIAASCGPVVADAGPDHEIAEGGTVHLAGGVQGGGVPPEDLLFVWDLNHLEDSSGDGLLTNDEDAKGQEIDAAYGDDGTFLVTLTVTGPAGVEATDTAAVIVTNVAPQVTVGTIGAGEGAPTVFHARVSDPGSDDLGLSWDWECTGWSESYVSPNDPSGIPDPDPSPQVNPRDVTITRDVVCGDDGTYEWSLEVTDDDGARIEMSGPLGVSNTPPTLTVLSPEVVASDEGTAVTLGAIAEDEGSDDLRFTWEWEFGPTATRTFFNDGLGPDPPRSPEGAFPFTATDSSTHSYGDDCVCAATLTVEDDDGGSITYTTWVDVRNVAPRVEDVEVVARGDLILRVAGEKFHDVTLTLFDNGTPVGAASVTRYPGSPDRQIATLGGVALDLLSGRSLTAVLEYTPLDDPVNGRVWGATPAWLSLRAADGIEVRIQHTFNARHEDTWRWDVDLRTFLVGFPIVFRASATDPGSDDLRFRFDFGDGESYSTTVFNDGVGRDPYPSPDYHPVAATVTTTHAYLATGSYMVQVSVEDDDGGSIAISVLLTL